jgi:nitroreductase
MLEAARWAASSYNSEPWRFIYARRDTPHWEGFLNLLVAGNQVWAKEASALMFLISNFTMRRPGTDTEVPSRTHSLDAGTASGYFALQASRWAGPFTVWSASMRSARPCRAQRAERLSSGGCLRRWESW